MSTKRNRNRRPQVSENVQNVPENTFIPPGAQAPSETIAGETVATESQTATGEEYPAVEFVNEEEHKAQLEKEAEERVERAKAVSSPKRLSGQEKLNMALLLTLIPEGHPANATPIPLESVPEALRASFFELGSKRNLAQRNLVKLITNQETNQIDALQITDIGLEVYLAGAKAVKEPKEPKAPKEPKVRVPREPRIMAATGDYISFTDDLRLKKVQADPRKHGTKGWYSWQLYEDGMNFREYMAKKCYPPGAEGFPSDWVTTQNMPFKGPSKEDWTWDLNHKFTKLYREGQPDKLEDGSPNPDYWVSHLKPVPEKVEAEPEHVEQPDVPAETVETTPTE